MRRIKLPGTTIECSALGFGCANLMGRVGFRQSLRALGCAHDLGVDYFDTARSYGWGKSEAVLGRFARGRRDRVVLASKLGILPPPHNPLLELARPVARTLLRLASAARSGRAAALVRSQVARRASPLVAHGRFDVASATRSLEDSLTSLGTDYLDVLLLHSCTAADVADGSLMEFLEKAQASGKVRYYGVATDPAACADILDRHRGVAVVQIPHSLLDSHTSWFDRPGHVAVNTHSPFAGGPPVEAIRRYLEEHPQECRDWSDRTGCNLSERGGIQELFLRFALESNGKGVVVCGMHSPEHIRCNARVAAGSSGKELLLSAAAEIKARIFPAP